MSADKMQARRESMRRASRDEVGAIMTLAGFEVSHVWELANGYWPDHPNYDDVRCPWWLFMTEIGPVRIGRRKRVIEIEWEACRVRGVVTADDVTKGDVYVHAWTVEKAIEYLRALRKMAAAQAAEGQKP